MANLSVTFAGLKLRNPFIVSSSGLTGSSDRIRKFDSLGAGAVVLKSIFEEQIRYEAIKNLTSSDYPEAYDYIKAYTRYDSLVNYLNLVKEAKKSVHIPVIASVNCTTSGEWIDFSSQIESAGADAIELNVFFLASDSSKPAQYYENVYFDLVAAIRQRITIPVIIKLGSQFTNLPYIVSELYKRKANGVTLFNRFYEPDINLDDLSITSSEILSSPADLRQSLRWVGLVSSLVDNIDIAASTGIHSGEAAIKQILAGAKAVQVCSVLYKNGVEVLPKLIDRLESWMIEMDYRTIDDFRGKLNYSHIKDPSVYERVQFMKYFSTYE